MFRPSDQFSNLYQVEPNQRLPEVRQHLHPQYYLLSIVASECYRSKSNDDFLELLDSQLSERKRLMHFLDQNKSTLPKKQLEGANRAFNLIASAEINNTPLQNNITDYYDQQRRKNNEYL